MRRRFLHWGLVAAALMSAYAAGSVVYVRWAMTKRAECSLPCRDLGVEVAIPGVMKDSVPVYRPACQPLDLKLELHRPQARRNTRHALWYRLAMRNVSCYRLNSFNAFEFGETWEADQVISGLGKNGDLVIRVWDPDGNEVPRQNFKVESPQTVLYHSDFAAYERLKPRLNSLLGLELGPGESVTSLPSMLWPRVIERGVDRKTLHHAWFWRPRPLPNNAEVPPQGFTILDSFVFERPGTYTVQAVYEAQITAEPIRPYARRIPNVLQLPLFIFDFIGVKVEPDSWPLLNHDYLMRAESEKVRFTVAP